MSSAKGKGKAAMATPSQEMSAESSYGKALFGARTQEPALDKIRFLVAGQTNEHGPIVLRTAELGERPQGFFRIFLH